MHTEIHDVWKSRTTLARPLLVLALALEATHVSVVLFAPRPLLPSNLLQLAFPLLAAVVSLVQATGGGKLARRCWSAVACAFLIWSSAQTLYLYFLHSPPDPHLVVRPDDALWLLFGLPLLLAVTTTDHERDGVAWLDRAQVALFFVVLYLLVFLPGRSLAASKAYLIQNLALVLCCIFRLPACRLPRERRFFVCLGLFLVAYASLETIGEFLYRHGAMPGSAVDLVWSAPITLFVVFTTLDALLPGAAHPQTSRLVRAVNTMQGLSVAAMAFLSMGVAALLATRRPALGGLFVGGAFLLFALRTNARERLWHQAHGRLEETVLTDALTGLGNRLMLRKCLAARIAAAEAGHIVLLFADLDRFKNINDSLGHALGDRLLVEVGARMRAASAPEAVVCRLGGDEFVVLTTAASPDAALKAGEAMLEALHTPFFPGSREVRCTASVGVVLAAPGEEADDLLRTADQAMYRAKQLGRDRVQLYDELLRSHMSKRWQMEAALRASIEANTIQVAFQPIYSVQQAAICGFEALARWSHPVLGNVPPSEFITLAEEGGLIGKLGEQVMEKACTQMAAWNRSWNTNLTVSVNVSPRQFTDPELIPSVLAILERTELASSLLRLEITETALLTQDAVVKETLTLARQHGIRISLDDFGTGYSSLSFLLSLPVDEVKVDRSFVSHMHEDPQRAELVRTVIHLGHSLGKRVVAEGVETEEDLVGLAEMGCECMQGYLISKPLLADALESELAALPLRSAEERSYPHRTPRVRASHAASEAEQQTHVPTGAARA